MDLKIEMLSRAGALGPQPITDDESESVTEDEDYIVEQSLVCALPFSVQPCVVLKTIRETDWG